VSTLFKSNGEVGKVGSSVYTWIALQFFGFAAKSYRGVSAEQKLIFFCHQPW